MGVSDRLKICFYRWGPNATYISNLGVESADMTDFRIGTSAFTAAGWESAFYPAGMKPADYLTYYATKFNTVEVDSTFYRTPSVATVNGWERKTPTGFSLAAKIPQAITSREILQGLRRGPKAFSRQ